MPVMLCHGKKKVENCSKMMVRISLARQVEKIERFIFSMANGILFVSTQVLYFNVFPSRLRNSTVL
jgi:magnesium-transporting ATPase (P-type)